MHGECKPHFSDGNLIHFHEGCHQKFLEPLCEKFSKKQQEKFLLNGYMKESEINYKQNGA